MARDLLACLEWRTQLVCLPGVVLSLALGRHRCGVGVTSVLVGSMGVCVEPYLCWLFLIGPVWEMMVGCVGNRWSSRT